MAHPSEGLRNLYLELIDRDSEYSNIYLEHTDKFITWIIGFCIAGISLLLSNESISKLLGETNHKIMVYLVASSAITGILYRWLSKGYSNEYYKATTNLIYKLNKGDHLKVLTNPNNLNDITSIKNALKNGLDEDVDVLISLFEIDNPNIDVLTQRLKNVYEDRYNSHLAQIKLTSDSFFNLYQETYGISDKKMEKEKVFSNKKLKFYRGASNALFLCSLLTFILAFVMIIIAI